MNQLALFEANEVVTVGQAQEIFHETAKELRVAVAPQIIQVEFYPFVGINHTIRFRNGTLFVRLSDLFEGSPREVIEALAIILLCKLFRKRIPATANHTYRSFVNSIDMREKSLVTRSLRGRKMQRAPKGRHYDLAQLFDELNEEYFQGRIQKVNLGWSLRKSRRILGHFDPSHGSITVSRIFDEPKTPEMVVRYILFHEMLHAKFATSSNFDLKNRHSRQFKDEEKKFTDYKAANDWLKHNL
jgi:predicted metal-dependent hydrolase